MNALLSIYSQFVKSGDSELMVEALKGLKKVIPYAGENFLLKEEREMLLAVICSASEVENVGNISHHFCIDYTLLIIYSIYFHYPSFKVGFLYRN